MTSRKDTWRGWRPLAYRRWVREHATADGTLRFPAGTPIEETMPPPSLVPWRYWLTSVRRCLDDAGAFVQRGRRGFAHQDTFNLQIYLAGVIADSVDHFREHPHSVPCALDETEWDRILATIGVGLRAARVLAEDDDLTDAERAQLEQRFRHGVALLTTWFHELWA